MLAEDFDIQCTMHHDMGTGGSGKWGVFSRGRLRDGNLDLHRCVPLPACLRVGGQERRICGVGERELGDAGPPWKQSAQVWAGAWQGADWAPP